MKNEVFRKQGNRDKGPVWEAWYQHVLGGTV